MVNRHICFIAMNLLFGWSWIRFPVVRGFSVLIRNSFWTACYYLWPLDVWIDLQALGPGHCVGHVWRRSRPLCVRQGPQISCPPPFPPASTALQPHPFTSTLWTKAYRTRWCFEGFGELQSRLCFQTLQMQKAASFQMMTHVQTWAAWK